jgi:uncharacterized protein (DUF2147 family)
MSTCAKVSPAVSQPFSFTAAVLVIYFFPMLHHNLRPKLNGGWTVPIAAARRGTTGELKMFKRITLPVLFLIILTAAPAGAVDADSVIGFWNTPDNDALFKIYRCESAYCGKISSLEEPNYPPTDEQMPGRPKVDRYNPNPALRNRTLVGLPLISGFQYQGDNLWKGMIYNPEDGRTYRCNFSMAGENLLKVRGYIGIPLLGGTQVWTRWK